MKKYVKNSQGSSWEFQLLFLLILTLRGASSDASFLWDNFSGAQKSDFSGAQGSDFPAERIHISSTLRPASFSPAEAKNPDSGFWGMFGVKVPGGAATAPRPVDSKPDLDDGVQQWTK